eukprot:TRINITY_DN469_c0_g2_i2.p1 TRINITY_DN469_c0_g2~~TRINITY_DN469_c0_g2_i2.p1  ORF type:complete len:1016 (+),score=383.73 TRINITY_DN469_c0_g2_i2:83-3130(+)
MLHAHDARLQTMQEKFERSISHVKKVLAVERNPQMATDVHHEYYDKYRLAEFVTMAACAGQLMCLETLGLTKDSLVKLAQQSRRQTVTLAFTSDETCSFDRVVSREVEAPTSLVTDIQRTTGNTTIKTKTVTTVTEYFWNIGRVCRIYAYRGTDKTDCVELFSASWKTQIKTAAKGSPHPARALVDGRETDLTWLLQAVSEETHRVAFSVDRTDKACHTPRRNRDVEKALDCLTGLGKWGALVDAYMKQSVFAVEQATGLNHAAFTAHDVLVPVLPLLELRPHDAEAGAVVKVSDVVGLAPCDVPEHCKVMLAGDLEALLVAQKESLQARLQDAARSLVGFTGLVTPDGTRVAIVGQHLDDVGQTLRSAVDFIELMLRRQLVQAIGKEVTSSDFTEYMRYHLRKVLRPQYAPREFSHAVQRAGRNPEGVVSIEQKVAGGVAEPIVTVSRCLSPSEARPMKFSLNASTDVRFHGERHVHSYVCHKFCTEAMPAMSLVGRARQFSGFVLMVGTIGGADLFLPKHAILLQNKDDLTLPLLLEQVPAPKEFQDAIESLSPEQQRFAKAYRALQLEATLFGVCVVHIKPQLEKVLNLPPDSLAKEVRLVQDLLELFIEYQIPSDLLSFQVADTSDEDASAAAKVERVRAHVAGVMEMIKGTQGEQLESQRLKAEMKRMQDKIDGLQQQIPQTVSGFGNSNTNHLMDLFGSAPARSGFGAAPAAAPGAFAFCGTPAAAAAPPVPKAFGPGDFDAAPAPAAAPVNPFGFGSAASGGFGASAAPAGNLFGSAAPAAAASPANPFASAAAPAAQPQSNTQENPFMDDFFAVEPPQQAGDTAAEETQAADKPAAEEDPLAEDSTEGAYDISKLPQLLDKMYHKLDEGGCLRPTILSQEGVWHKRFRKTLLSKEETDSMGTDAQKKEKDRAFDLLDALTRSGALDIDCATLHVVVAATHSFDSTLMDTLVCENVNPIEKVERSALIAACAVHAEAAVSMLSTPDALRVRGHSPQLFIEGGAQTGTE